MASVPAVPPSAFLKAKERKELEKKLHRITELKLQKDNIEAELKGDGTNPGLIDEVTAELLTHGQKKVEFEGFTHMVLESQNVTYPWGKIQAALLRHGVDPDIISDVQQEAKNVTPYTTITTLPVKAPKFQGGLTGK